MKIKLILILVLLYPFITYVKPEEKSLTSVNDICSNYIFISGETNINQFELSQFINLNDDFFVSYDNIIHDSHDGVHHIHIPVKNFETDNRLMYKDFLEILKEKQFPQITIGIDEKFFNKMLSCEKEFSPEINITIAGISQSYLIPCTVIPCQDDTYFLKGTRKIRLSDFKIDPPVKSLGLIKVKDELIINFGFSFIVS